MHVAVFGGSFDPPHAGHVLIAAYLGTVAAFEHVVVVPVSEHAFEKDLSPFPHRLRMCQLAFEVLPFVEVTPIEATLKRPNYTLHTLQAIKRAHPDWHLRLAMGADVLTESAQWHAFSDVVALAPPFVFARHGTLGDAAKTQLFPDISSTQIRGWLRARSDSLAQAALGEFLAPNVRAYIEEQGLYA